MSTDPPTGNTRPEHAPSQEKIDLSDPATRIATAEQALVDLRNGRISAAAATSIASLIRTATDNRLQEMQTRLDELSEYAKSLEDQLSQVSPRGRR